MALKQNRLLFLAVFVNDKRPGINIRTSTDRIAGALMSQGFRVICSSSQSNRWIRLVVQLWTIIGSRKNYDVAILPLFGTKGSIWWHRILSAGLRLMKKRLVITVDGGSIPAQIENGDKRFFKILSKAESVICPSSYMFEAVKKYPLKRIVQIENVVDLKQYPFQIKKSFQPVLLWMRGFERFYNPEMAIRVTVLLKKKYPDFRLIMAGKNGPLLDVVKQMVKESDLGNNVSFPGYLLQHEKISYAREASIFICTNSVDNAPVSLIEFMALGTVIVSTDVGGIAEIIDSGTTGYLVERDDDAAMFERVKFLLENPDHLIQMANAARRKALQYDIEPIVEKWLPLL